MAELQKGQGLSKLVPVTVYKYVGQELFLFLFLNKMNRLGADL